MKFICVLLMLSGKLAYSEDGWTYIGDINGDGVNDTIKSGPSELFGNGGGPFVIEISKEGKFEKHVIGMHPLAVSIEYTISNKGKRHILWTYRRSSPNEGVLT